MSKNLKHAESLAKRTWTGERGDGQSHYDFDDNKASPTRIGTSHSQDCWREDLYAKYGVTDAN